MRGAVVNSAQRMAGVGLIEVLVALLVISIGMLGYAGLQLRALNSTEETHFRTQATAIAQDLAERIAANPQGQATYLNAGNWTKANVTANKPAGWDACVENNCDPVAMAESDILQIRIQAAQLLLGGQASAQQCGGSDAICVTVSWRDTTPANCAPPAAECVRLEVVSWMPGGTP